MALSDELEALAKRHGATSYRNRADTQHPAYGFTEDGLNGLIGEVLAKWSAQDVPASQGDALDAARLDWLTFNLSGKALRDIGVVWSEHGDARRAIDAARAAQEGK